MSAVMIAGLPPRAVPPPYVSAKSDVDAAEVEQLAITAIRRTDQVLTDIQRLALTPATLADVLRPDLVLARVDFDAVDACQRAALRLAVVLGEDGQVSDPRPDCGGLISVSDVLRMAEGLIAAAAPYRRLRTRRK